MAETLGPVTHASVLRIAVPIMLSNVSEPMIGVVNTAVLGRLPEPHYIGAVAVGALIFGFLFWGFGFLRLSTSGMAAQALGAGEQAELGRIVLRSLLLAFAIGVILILASPVLGPASVGLIGGSAKIQSEALTYFNYRILTAPAALCNFAILGWFIGQSRANLAFATQLFLNLANVALSYVCVVHFGMRTAGVGLAVLIAEYAAVALGLALVLKTLAVNRNWPSIREALDLKKLKAAISANFDIMIRTFCLAFAFGWFTSRGARAGDVIIAANAVLLNLFEVSAFLIDGFGFAAEALVGQSIGERNRKRFGDAIKLTTIWAMIAGTICSISIWLFGLPLISLLTTNSEVVSAAMIYLPWAALTPFLGALCFQFDGIYTGALATRSMRNMMVVSLAIYLAAWALLEPRYGNHGLWIALCIFFVARGVTYAWKMPALTRAAFTPTGSAQSQSAR